MLTLLLMVVWLLVAGTATLMGLEYYLLPLQDRAFSPLAEQFAPTGFWGHGFGIVGTLLMLIGVVGYMLRKRVSWLESVGSLRSWLQVHIFLCTLGPYLVLLHTTFKFGGVVAISFWSMTIVVASGIFGRYVYVRIPKTVQGRFLGADALEERLRAVAERLRYQVDLTGAELAQIVGPELTVPQRPPGLGGAILLAIRGDLADRWEFGRLRRTLRTRGVPRSVREDLLSLGRERSRMRRQALMTQPFQRLFRYWHVVHLPLAITMTLILALHVGVAVAFGYTWIWGG